MTQRTDPNNAYKLHWVKVVTLILLAAVSNITFAQERDRRHETENKPAANVQRVRQQPTSNQEVQSNRQRQPILHQDVQTNRHTVPTTTGVQYNRTRGTRPVNSTGIQDQNTERIPTQVTNRTVNVNRTYNSNTTNNTNRTYNANRTYNPGRNYNNRPRPVYNASNPGWHYANLPRRNSIINTLPATYRTINYNGFNYRYNNGVFYRPYNNTFMVIAPPIGIFLNILPFGYRRIYVNNYPYFYYNGTYYDRQNDNYLVVSPPVGAVVESLPPGYETVVVDGETYYTVDGAQYKPVMQENGEIWYEVIKSN